MSQRIFSEAELLAAIEMISLSKVPWWMNYNEKKAYALGVIGDEHVINCPRCKGRGWLVSCNPYANAACSCPGSTGKIISDAGKILVKEAFPE